MSNELVLVDVVGLGDPGDGSRPSLPRWAFDQVRARGWRFVAEYRVPPEHVDPEDDWSLEPYWAVVLWKEVQLVVEEEGQGPLVVQALELSSWTLAHMSERLYPEFLQHLIGLGDLELWLRVEEAA